MPDVIGTASNAWLALRYAADPDALGHLDHPVARRQVAWDAEEERKSWSEYATGAYEPPAPVASMPLRCIGAGESRAAYLIDGVVYKVGRDSANEYEHHWLTVWRNAGAHWAPPTTLHEVTDEHGDQHTVIAMPYHPDDSADNAEDLAEIKAAAPQTCPENWRSTGGRTYLIDGVDIERSPKEVRASRAAAPAADGGR